MYKHILVSTDGSKLSSKAVKAAVALAKALGARLTALYVTAPFRPPVYGEGAIYSMQDFSPKRHKEAMQKAARHALSEVEIEAQSVGVDCKTLANTGEQPWETIVRAAKAKKCDLIVMASHGRRGLTGLLLGSETTKVLTHSKIPVLVCR
jgi:nucleotide-binding universal stress UspA family protein